MWDWGCRPLRWLALRRATALGVLVAFVLLGLIGYLSIASPAEAATPTFSVIKTLDLGSKAPYQVAVNPSTNDAFIVSGQSNKLWVVKDAGSSSSLLATLACSSGDYMHGVAVNPSTGDVFIASDNGYVFETHDDGAATAPPSVIDTHGLDHLHGVAVNPNTGHIFVADYSSHAIYVYKDTGATSALTQTFNSTVITADRSDQIAVNTSNDHVYVEHNSDAAGDLNIFQDSAGDSGVSLLTSVSVGVIGYGVGVNPTTGHIFFTGTRNAPPVSYDEVAVIQDEGVSTAASDIIQRSDGPDVKGVAVDTSRNYVFIATPFGGSNGAQLYQDSPGSGSNVLTSVEAISTGASPHFIQFNSMTNDLIGPDYANGYGTSVAILSDGAKTVTNANDASATTSATSVSLSASVLSGDSPVTEGSVTFTVTDSNGKTVGSSVSGTLNSNGQSSATFAIPSGTAAGSYTITAAYADTGGGFGTSLGTSTLTLSGTLIPTVTVADNLTINFQGQLNLSATVTASGQQVSEGLLTFTVTTPDNQTTICSATVAPFGSPATEGCFPSTFPTGLRYTIHVVYSDGGGKYAPSSDTSTLSINPVATRIQAKSATADYGATSVDLSATMSMVGSYLNQVNEGTITFSVIASDGHTVLCTATATPNGTGTGTASCNFASPPTPGTYVIHASFSDPGHVFQDSSDNTQSLTINSLTTKTTVNDVSASYGTEVFDLTASITSGGQPVGEGAVLFLIYPESSETPICRYDDVAVFNGSASSPSAVICDPNGRPLAVGSYTIYAAYSDSSGKYGASQGTGTLTIGQVATQVSVPGTSVTYGQSSINLSARVSSIDSSDVINTGTITFTVSSGTSILCTSDAIAVVNGKVTNVACDFGSPTPAVGKYEISAKYIDPSGNFVESSNTGTLAVGPASLSITADDESMIYGDSVPTFTVSYDKFLNGDTADSLSGTLICQAKDKSGNAPSSTTPVGQYSIDCSSSTLSDVNYDISYQPGTLTITPRDTTTGTGDISLTYGATSASLTATVAAKDDTSLTVNEGTVTFTVSRGTTTFCTSAAVAVNQGQVSGGSCAIGLLDQGSYTITASYTDAAGNFADSSDTATLTIGAAASKTSLSNSPTVIVGTTSLPLSASVTSSGLTVGQGNVTFVVTDTQGNQIASQTGQVTSGEADVTLTLPANAPLGVYTITASYHDSTGDFTDSSGRGTLTITNGTVIVGGNPIIVHHDYWALVRVQVTNASGKNLSRRTLKVTAQNLAPVGQPWNGKNGNFVYAFQYSSSISGYQLAINSRPLSIGDYTLSYTIAGDPVVHTVTIRVVP